ncbi:MAG: L-aspartate oxidase [Rehaibacterium terrae]|uniref:L-aspartate oxidase n=1 Tax=Rehaibacterium terrae TaxID=1341696 RepID=UPI00391AD3CA
MSLSGAPLVVVGAGVAGLSVALAAAPRRVLLLSRGHGGLDGSSALAQGGIAAALGPDDSPALHAADTLAAGAHHNAREAVHLLTAQAPAAIAWLARQGVPFDREHGGWALGREGGHGHARILHAGGDASGRALVLALAAAVRRAGHVEWREGVEVEALLLRDGHVAGVRVRADDGTDALVEASAVVLASGGLGALFAATTNPATVDGAGLALALAAGARARDIEFVQFHPTALAADETACRLPLVTEALRGAGAVLRDRDGRPLMRGVHPQGDLAPRDIVSRRVWQARHTGAGAFLHAQHLGDGFAAQFPTVFAACMAHGIDPRREPIPVTPAAHFHMGGVAVDLDGRSSLPGLYAVGEVACSGVHGANRLASNSLLEGVVFGRRVGARLGAALPSAPARGPWREVARAPAAAPAALARLRRLFWESAGPLRDGAGLRAALAQLRDDEELRASWQGALAGELLTAALARTASLGAHFRCDADGMRAATA